jgi:uncharacterized protein
MELRRYKDIVAFKTLKSELIAFHPRNLEIAQIDEAAWANMKPHEITNGLQASPDQSFADLEEWSAFEAQETSDLKQSNSVRYYSVNIAQICNLKCTYCAAGGDGTYGSATTKVDTSKVEKQLTALLANVGNSAATPEQFEIRFLGGEPLLYPSLIRQIANFAQLLVAGRNIELLFSITTNGTLITPKVAELLAELKTEVTISLDGDSDINDKVRPAKGSISSTSLTLRGLQELKKVRSQLRGLKVNSVFGAHNLEVLATYKYLMSLDMNWDSLNLNYANNEDIENSIKYIGEMSAVAEHAYKNYELFGLAQITQFRSTLARLETQTRIHSYCGAGKSLLQADTKTNLFTCNWLMNDNSEAVTTEAWPVIPETLIEKNNCQTCWARHLCGGGCMAVHKAKTGSKHEKDPAFCYRQRSLSAISIEYFFEALNLTNETNTAAITVA